MAGLVVADIPRTVAASNHGMVITLPDEGDKPIGGIFEFTDNQQRQVTPMWEFGAVTVGFNDEKAAAGEPFEGMPGNITGTTLNIACWETFNNQFAARWSEIEVLDMLSRQRTPFRIAGVIYGPDNPSPIITNEYLGFWFTSLGEQQSAEGARNIRIQASAFYTRKRKSPRPRRAAA